MDNSWHHRPPPPPPPPPPPSAGGAPPPQATVCPVCSMYHFPFCPPPFPQSYPSHYQYPPPPPPQADQFYPRPPPPPPPAPLQPLPPPPPNPPPPAYDPFVDHQGGPALKPQRPFFDSQRPPWPPNSSFDRDPHGIMYRTDYYSNPGSKRMRFDDSGFPPSPALHSSDEDERRLKLIRDHGGAISGGEARSFDRPSTNLGTSNSFHPGYGDFDEKSKFYSQKNNLQRYEDDRFGQQYNQSNRNAEYGQLSHSNVESSLHQNNAYDCSGHSFNGVEQPRQNNEAMGHSWQGVSGIGAAYSDQRSGFGRESLHKYAMQHGMESMPNQYGLPYSNNQSGKNIGLHPDSRVFSCQPPLPTSPPPPLPMEPPGQHLVEPVVTASPSGTSASLFPIASGASTAARSSYPRVTESSPLPSAYHPNRSHLHASTGFVSEELQTTRQAPYKAYFGSEVLPHHPPSPEKVKIVDASHILKHPHWATRPDHIVIILRGLPGSGKSYLAKLLRDLEVENGGNAPRIHSMDDYFMTEVEKVEESETPRTSGSVRGKRPVTKKVIEYCYEPEMEEAYRSSMLKAFKKTLDEGVFSFVIVDDRNLRVADFAQFWATAKRSGYEVYVLEATYKDPAGCAARNVHGFTQEDIQKMADLWEEAPSLYFKLDIKSLLHGDGLVDSGIQEVDMDMEDGDPVCGPSGSEERNAEKLVVPHEGDLVSDGTVKEDQRWDSEAYHPVEEVKDLGKSKWSNDLNDDNIHKNEAKGNLNALSGIKQSYNKEGKSVRWGDQACNSGFSIAAARTANVASLVIGPGGGYNLKSNPLADEEKTIASHSTGQSMKHNVFQERLRAEHESFRAVFDKRKQRISWLNGEED